ncbi:MAG: MFS transporter [Acetobacteraceae bacterium]|nr:MFS transporter [Acetobacteraceae bacterium]
MFLAVVDQTIVATALPSIAASLGDVERISWIVIAYLIAGTVAAPVYGYYGDLYGRRKVMFVALCVFIVASCLCAAAPSMLTLVLARVLQGLGGGGLMTLSQALIGETVPPRERARYQGYLAAVVVCSSTFGPVAGGLLTQTLGWRSVFFVNVPLGAIALWLARRLPSKKGFGERPLFDIVGLALFICFAVPLLVGLERLQAFDRSAFFIAALSALIGIVSLMLLLKRESHTLNPLFPVGLLKRPEIWRADAMAALHGAALVSLITFLPLYLRVVHGTSATQTGLLLLPLTAGIGFGSMITGQIVSRTGRTMIVSTIGLAVVTLLLLLQAAFAVYMNVLELTALWGITALFMGSVMGVVQVTVQNAAGRERLGAAAASVQLSRSVGASFGTALIGTVLFVTLAIMDVDGAHAFTTMIEQGASALDALPAARHAIVQTEIAQAFRAAFLMIAAFTAGAGLLALTNPAKRLT